MELLEDVLGIPMSEASLLEYDGCVNLMKGGIEAANAVTTVSPTYAKEILDPLGTHTSWTLFYGSVLGKLPEF